MPVCCCGFVDDLRQRRDARVIGAPLGRFAGGQYLVEPFFAVPAGPLEVVRLESPEAPRWIQAEEEEDPFRPLARLRSDLQRLELQLFNVHHSAQIRLDILRLLHFARRNGLRA
eukprot:scaffold49567_cov63-Phaeocystis_antarctica.AAC.4